MLSARDDFSRADMNAMQLDTQSEYHRRLIQWMAARTTVPERWKRWKGEATADADTFTDAIEVERLFEQLLVNRVRAHFGVPDDVRYSARLDSAWVLTALGAKGALAAFGLDETEVAESIVARVTGVKRAPYFIANRWQAQHPFVGRIPLVGDFFRVDEPEQAGWHDVVRVEQPKYGASTRLVWDLVRPDEQHLVASRGAVRARTVVALLGLPVGLVRPSADEGVRRQLRVVGQSGSMNVTTSGASPIST